MPGSIKFLSGERTNRLYFYRHIDLFKKASRDLQDSPLHLTDFKDVEVISTGPLGLMMLVKCTFGSGEESIARIDYSMLETFKIFLHSTKNMSPDHTPVFPKSYVAFKFGLGVLLLMLALILKIIS